jgi:xanthine/CO dehydrogenase XdhC/CoxF family maturation factor
VNTSDKVLRELLYALDTGRPVALVTVVLAEGSLTDTLGRRAVVWELGQHVEVRGDLGLGDLEAQARDAAWKVLETRRSKLIEVEVENGRRVHAVFQLLEEEKDIPRERFARVHSPIGLDIGSETPAEIAVSIMAEIITVRRGGTGLPLSDGR